MAPFSRFPLSRRNFMAALAFGTGSLLLKDYVAPLSAIADSSTPTDAIEAYHIFVPYTKAQRGGEESLLLRSGDYIAINIPRHAQDGKQIFVMTKGQTGKEIQVTLHTLYNLQGRISDQVSQEIKNAQFIEPATKEKCSALYTQLEDGDYIEDVCSLDLFDYLILTSNKIDEKTQERYQLARTNSGLLGMQQALEKALTASSLSDNEKKQIRSAFAYVRAGEPIPDFKALSDLDAIIIGSNLPSPIKKSYSLASANSRALTADFIIVNLIQDNPALPSWQRYACLDVYKRVRDGLEVSDSDIVQTLDKLIENSNIPITAKVIYALARKQEVDSEGNNIGELVGQVGGLIRDARDLKKDLEEAQATGAAFVPTATKVLSAVGVETATGVSFSTLSGAAATNATLAFLGGGSVASGGLGMLGGLAVATGGAALLGAAGLLSIALIAEMDNEDRLNLGIAVGSGTLAGAASVLAAWTAASALGVTGTLSGAAAITAMISALGGLSVVTGGAALVASGVAFLIWSILQGGKKRDQGILKQLEARSYTLIDDPQPDSLGAFLKDNLLEEYYLAESFSSSNIPVDKLSNALNSWLKLDGDEKVLSLVDCSIWDDAKAGVAFTERRVIWKANYCDHHGLEYKKIAQYFWGKLAEEAGDELTTNEKSAIAELIYNILEKEDDTSKWINILKEASQKYSVA